MRLHVSSAMLLLSMLCSACGSTGQQRLQLPARAAGNNEAALFNVGGWQVALGTAQVAIGPLYLCASESTSTDFCSSALAEIRSSAHFDALQSAPVDLGTLAAISGTARSAQFDYGISWWLTHPSAQPTEGAIDGHSARFVGSATRGAEQFRFRADLDIAPQLAGRNSVATRFDAHALQTSEEVLVVSVDARAWWQRVDFDALFASAMNSVASEVQILPGSLAYDTLAIAMTSGAPPLLQWLPWQEFETE